MTRKKCQLCVFQSAESAVSSGQKISLMSDVEGDLDYFDNFVQNSTIIQWSNDKKTSLSFRPGCDDCHFVLAGDTQDIGIGDIRFVRLLLNFEDEYKERVHLIIGNRDCNKLRLLPELRSVEQWNEGDTLLFEDGFPFWNTPDQKKSLNHWTETIEGKTQEQLLSKESFASKTLTNKKKTYLQWAFNNTFGMPDSFENRRKELKIMAQELSSLSNEQFELESTETVPRVWFTDNYGKKHTITKWTDSEKKGYVCLYFLMGTQEKNTKIKVTTETYEKLKLILPRDEEVIESFQKECDPECNEMYEWKQHGETISCPKNYMYRYLRRGKLMIVQDKAVFCHGGLTHKNLWKVPTTIKDNQLQYETFKPSKTDTGREIQTWCDKLEKWKLKQLTEYSFKHGNVYHGGNLAAYGVPPLPGGNDLHQNSQSVLYTNMLTKLKNGVNMDDVVLRAMDSAGLSIIGTGHQPVFDCALILRTKLNDKDFFSVTVDTCKSESGVKSWWGKSNRKKDNVHEVVIQGKTIFTHGHLGNNNRRIADKNTLSFECNTRDPLIGTSFAYKTKLKKEKKDAADSPDKYEDLTYWIRAELKNGDYYCVATHGFDNYPLRARKLKKDDFCPQCMNGITYNTCFELLPFDLESKQAGSEKWYLCQASNGSNVCCKDLPSVKATNSAPVSLLPALQSVQDSSGKKSLAYALP